jgi:hypothetical protein
MYCWSVTYVRHAAVNCRKKFYNCRCALRAWALPPYAFQSIWRHAVYDTPKTCAKNPRDFSIQRFAIGRKLDFEIVHSRIKSRSPGRVSRVTNTGIRGDGPEVLTSNQIVGMVPPSMTYSLPVIADARSEARKATSSATSSGRFGRPSGIPPSESINCWRAVG